jgi:hypothetical protein
MTIKRFTEQDVIPAGRQGLHRRKLRDFKEVLILKIDTML